MQKKHYNKLVHEKSPYLLQHAENPVDWYPWGEQAFEKARSEDKPLFLSIGYSTCHWCHVMAHESFEDPEVARRMNEAFVSIKVDREERPDVDSIYMTVCQMMTGKGGWPLTIIMTPDKEPFFAATYIPKENRFGRVGLLELIPHIAHIWKESREDLLRVTKEVIKRLTRKADPEINTRLDLSVLHAAYQTLSQTYDQQYGGFGNAPKFPNPTYLFFLLRYWNRTKNQHTLDMVKKTLSSMRRGGIYDHIGFGFHRYSTSRNWLVPHFEKMLYDQALLALAYTEAFQAIGEEEYTDTVQEIFRYVLRDMKSPEGGFYSAEDADSEGEEGRFYLWEYDEVREVVGRELADMSVHLFDIQRQGNYREEATGARNGKNILHMVKGVDEFARLRGLSVDESKSRIETVRRLLFDYREKRVHPYRDDKILTDWNGLMIAALARGYQVFGVEEYLTAAESACAFLLGRMAPTEARLLHRYRDGEALIPGALEDYTFLGFGLLELYAASLDPHYLQTALKLNQTLFDHFWDEENGGFYKTADDSETIIVRTREVYDGALPSGNGMALINLLKIAAITGEATFLQKAERLLASFSKDLRTAPHGSCSLLSGLDFSKGPTYEVVISGELTRQDTQNMLKAVRTRFFPSAVLLFRPVNEDSPLISDIAPYTLGMKDIDGRASCYVCVNGSCKMPTTDIEKILEELKV